MNFPRVLAAVLAVASTSLAAAAESKHGAEAKATGEAKAAATPSPSAMELARVLVPKENWAAGVAQLSQNVQSQMQGHPGSSLRYPPDFPDKVRAEVEKILPYDEFAGMHAKELSANFTEPELKDVLAFYRMPAGQKWLRDMGKWSQAVSQETAKRFEQKMPEVMTRLGTMAQSSSPSPPGKNSGQAPPTAAGHGNTTPPKSNGK